MRSELALASVALVVGWVLMTSAAVADEGLGPPPPRPEGARDVAIDGDGEEPRRDGRGGQEGPIAPPPPDFAPRPSPTQPADAFLHDGGFLRFTMGPLIAAGSAKNLLSPGRSDRPSLSGSVFGVGTLTAITGGGSFVPGFVLAARLGIGVLVDPGLSEEESNAPSKVMKTIVVPTIGPVIDIYPWPEMGLHLFANPSLTIAHFEREEAFDVGLVGYSLAGGVGYEAWVSEQWSVGGQLRIDGSGFKRKDEPSGDSTSVMWWTPSLQVAFTYH